MTINNKIKDQLGSSANRHRSPVSPLNIKTLDGSLLAGNHTYWEELLVQNGCVPSSLIEMKNVSIRQVLGVKTTLFGRCYDVETVKKNINVVLKLSAGLTHLTFVI